MAREGFSLRLPENVIMFFDLKTEKITYCSYMGGYKIGFKSMRIRIIVKSSLKVLEPN